MEHVIEAGADALVMDDRDHVATALRDMAAGETIRYRGGSGLRELTLLDFIPFGHKVAVAAIEAGDHVRKYGEVIGRATEAIPVGRHVHIHNIEGIRGRGDQAGSREAGKEERA